MPEPKAVERREHLDFTATHLQPLLDAATLLRDRDDEIGGNLLAGPEGNECCAIGDP